MAASAIKTALDSNDTKWLRDLLVGVSDWRQATETLVDVLSYNLVPFSSGEIAAALRVLDREDVRAAKDPNVARFRFSVTSIGEFLRNRFYANTLPHLQGPLGAPVYPQQIACVTTGAGGRTQAGQVVFVYAIDDTAARAHPFEVVVQDPRNYLSDGPVPSLSSTTLPQLPATTKPVPVVITGALAQDKVFEARVTDDGRVRVPRRAFENFVLKAGRTLTSGDEVFYVVDKNLLVVSLDPVPGTFPKKIESSDGRLRINVRDTHPLSTGDRFRIAITAKSLSVDLSNPV